MWVPTGYLRSEKHHWSLDQIVLGSGSGLALTNLVTWTQCPGPFLRGPSKCSQFRPSSTKDRPCPACCVLSAHFDAVLTCACECARSACRVPLPCVGGGSTFQCVTCIGMHLYTHVYTCCTNDNLQFLVVKTRFFPDVINN